MTNKQRFASVWDALEDTPQEAARMKARSALRMVLAVGAGEDKDLMNAPRHVSHDETVVEMLKADPDFANDQRKRVHYYFHSNEPLSSLVPER